MSGNEDSMQLGEGDALRESVGGDPINERGTTTGQRIAQEREIAERLGVSADAVDVTELGGDADVSGQARRDVLKRRAAESADDIEVGDITVVQRDGEMRPQLTDEALLQQAAAESDLDASQLVIDREGGQRVVEPATSVQRERAIKDVLADAPAGVTRDDIVSEVTEDGVSARISDDAISRINEQRQQEARQEAIEDVLADAPAGIDRQDIETATEDGQIRARIQEDAIDQLEQQREQQARQQAIEDVLADAPAGIDRDDVNTAIEDGQITARIQEDAIEEIEAQRQQQAREEAIEDVLADAPAGIERPDIQTTATDQGVTAQIDESALDEIVREDFIEQIADQRGVSESNVSVQLDAQNQLEKATITKKPETVRIPGNVVIGGGSGILARTESQAEAFAAPGIPEEQVGKIFQRKVEEQTTTETIDPDDVEPVSVRTGDGETVDVQSVGQAQALAEAGAIPESAVETARQRFETGVRVERQTVSVEERKEELAQRAGQGITVNDIVRDGDTLTVSDDALSREAVETVQASLAPGAVDAVVESEADTFADLPEEQQEQLAEQSPIDEEFIRTTVTEEGVETELQDIARKALAKQEAVDDIDIAQSPRELDATITEDGEVEVSPDLERINDRVIESEKENFEGLTEDRLEVLRGEGGETVVVPASEDAAFDRLQTAFTRLRDETPPNTDLQTSPQVRDAIDEGSRDDIRELIAGEDVFAGADDPEVRDIIQDISGELAPSVEGSDQARERLADALADISRFESEQQKEQFVFGDRDPSQTQVIDPGLGIGDQIGQSVPVSDVVGGQQAFERQLRVEQARDRVAQATIDQSQFASDTADVQTGIEDVEAVVNADSVQQAARGITAAPTTDAVVSEFVSREGIERDDIQVADGRVTIDQPQRLRTGATGIRGRAGRTTAAQETASEDINLDVQPLGLDGGEPAGPAVPNRQFQRAEARARQRARSGQQGGQSTQLNRDISPTPITVGEGVNVGLGEVEIGGTGQVSERQQQSPEQFGDIPITVETPTGPQRLESILGDAAEDISGGIEDVAGGVADFIGADNIELDRRSVVGPDREVSGEETESFVEGTVTGALQLGNVPATALAVKEGVEFGVEGVEETAAGRGGEFAERAAAAGVAAGREAVEAFERNPAKIGGQVVGSLALSTGAIAGASRFGGPRISKGLSSIVQPGEELAITAAKRGVVPVRAATKVPGVRRGQIGEFIGDTRGQLDFAGSKEVETETDVDVDIDRGPPRATGRPGFNPSVRRGPTEIRSEQQVAEGPSQTGTETSLGFRRAETEAETAKVTPELEQETEAQIEAATETRLPETADTLRFLQRAEGELTETEVQQPEIDIEQSAVQLDGQQSESGFGRSDARTEFSGLTEKELETLREGVTTRPEARARLASQPEIATDIEPRLSLRAEAKAATTPQLTVRPEIDTGIESRLDTRPETGIEPRSDARGRTEIGVDTRTDVRTDARTDVRTETRTETRSETTVEPRQEARSEARIEARFESRSEPRVDIDEPFVDQPPENDPEAAFFQKTFTSPVAAPGELNDIVGSAVKGSAPEATDELDAALDDADSSSG